MQSLPLAIVNLCRYSGLPRILTNLTSFHVIFRPVYLPQLVEALLLLIDWVANRKLLAFVSSWIKRVNR